MARAKIVLIGPPESVDLLLAELRKSPKLHVLYAQVNYGGPSTKEDYEKSFTGKGSAHSPEPEGD